jgi:hypothetical protein
LFNVTFGGNARAETSTVSNIAVLRVQANDIRTNRSTEGETASNVSVLVANQLTERLTGTICAKICGTVVVGFLSYLLLKRKSKCSACVGWELRVLGTSFGHIFGGLGEFCVPCKRLQVVVRADLVDQVEALFKYICVYGANEKDC